jgi:ABC-2 type transport system ATP-binding protein
VEFLIEAHDLRKAFGDVVAVDGISLTVGEGEVYALVGPDGAGKTTTMRLLCGALRSDEGRVTILGHDLNQQTEQARSFIGYLPQRFSLYGELTALENLRFFAEVRGLAARDWAPRAKEILEFVGLLEFADRRAEALSGGMRQKLGLAAALVHRPRVLLLDEPTGGVDAVTRQAFWQLLIQLLHQGVAVLISTPYMDEASRCTRVGFMTRGKILLEGPPSEIVRRLEGQVIELIGEPKRIIEQIARSDPRVEDIQMFGDRFHLRVAPGSGRRVITMLKRAVRKEGGSIAWGKQIIPGLEDVFIELLEGNG